MDEQSATRWVSACLKKKKLREEWADSIVLKATEDGGYLRKYLCPHCLGWHVTSKKPFPKKKESA